jgi:hypothetical protein
MRVKLINNKKQSDFFSSASRMINKMMKSIHNQIIIWIARFVDLNQRFFVQIVLFTSFMQDVHFDQNNQRKNYLIIRVNTLYKDDIITIIWIRHTKRFSRIKNDHQLSSFTINAKVRFVHISHIIIDYVLFSHYSTQLAEILAHVLKIVIILAIRD